VCGDSDLHGSSDTRGPCDLYQGRQAQRMKRHVVACFYMHQLRVQNIVGSQEPDGLGRVVCPSRHHHLNVGVCRSPNYCVSPQPHLLPEWQKRASGRCVAPVQHAVERNPHQPHVPTYRLRAVIYVRLGALSAPAAALTHRQHCLRQARRQLTRTCSDATLGLASYARCTSRCQCRVPLPLAPPSPAATAFAPCKPVVSDVCVIPRSASLHSQNAPPIHFFGSGGFRPADVPAPHRRVVRVGCMYQPTRAENVGLYEHACPNAFGHD